MKDATDLENKIILGDVIENLRTIADNTFDFGFTSPEVDFKGDEKESNIHIKDSLMRRKRKGLSVPNDTSGDRQNRVLLK